MNNRIYIEIQHLTDKIYRLYKIYDSIEISSITVDDTTDVGEIIAELYYNKTEIDDKLDSSIWDSYITTDSVDSKISEYLTNNTITCNKPLNNSSNTISISYNNTDFTVSDSALSVNTSTYYTSTEIDAKVKTIPPSTGGTANVTYTSESPISISSSGVISLTINNDSDNILTTIEGDDSKLTLSIKPDKVPNNEAIWERNSQKVTLTQKDGTTGMVIKDSSANSASLNILSNGSGILSNNNFSIIGTSLDNGSELLLLNNRFSINDKVVYNTFQQNAFTDAWTDLSGSISSSANGNGSVIATDKKGTWMIGLNSYLYKSTDNGNTWNEIQSTAGLSISYVFSIATDSNGTWIVGSSYGRVCKTTDNGSTWENIGSKFNFGDVITNHVKGIATDSKGNWLISCIGSGDNGRGKTFKSTDNGNDWTDITTDVDILAKSQDVRYMATDSKGTWIFGGHSNIYISTDNMTSWQDLSVKLNSSNFRSVATDSKGTWIIGSMLSMYDISTDNGNTWRYMTASKSIFNSLATNSNGIWLSAGEGAGSVCIYKSLNNGNNFIDITSITSIPTTTIINSNSIAVGLDDTWILIGETSDSKCALYRYQITPSELYDTDNNKLCTVQKDWNSSIYVDTYNNSVELLYDQSFELNNSNQLTTRSFTTTATSSQTITHDTKPEEPIENYELGKPCFMTGNVYRRENDKWILSNDASNNLSDLTTNVIAGAKSTGKPNEFLGIITKIDKSRDIVQFATHGDYLYKTSNDKTYSIGDIITYDGTILKPDDTITFEQQLSIIGKVSKVNINNSNEYIAVFKYKI